MARVRTSSRPPDRSGVRRKGVAIIGMSCRTAGAGTPDELWQLLRSCRDATRDLAEGRWDPHRWYHPDPQRPGKMYSQRGGYLDAVDLFDPGFFGISPREARQMDPQQRLLLEMAWEALEDAGQVPARLAGSRTGVFVGISNFDYGVLPRRDVDQIDVYTNTGGALSIAANRLSYFFDFHGPSFALDTACSSSLVAIHEACQSLWRGESSLALAGGVNLVLRPEPGVGFCKASMLSRAGRIRAFDAEADGFVRAEGGGLLALKSLPAALAAGDPIRAVILATGISTNGRTAGIFLPSPAAQADLLRDVLRQAGVPPGEVSYVEAHGTGTPVGDPAECVAIGSVIGAGRQPSEPCLVGSIKPNVGHLEAASGVAGAVKAVLCLEHGEVPPTLHFQTPNPAIPFDELKLSVVKERTALPRRRKPLVAVVNSFGFGGANASIVLEEHRELRRERSGIASQGSPMPLVLSARSPEALTQLARGVTTLLRSTGVAAYDVCHTTAFRRSRLEHCFVAFGHTADELAGKLSRLAEGECPDGAALFHASRPGAKLAFVFGGNGPQWWAMGRELLEHDPLFRTAVEAIDRLLEPLVGWSLLDELLAGEQASRMRLTEVAQPALFALQVGIVERLRASGVTPDAVLGHSVGEVAAAFACGALTLPQAVRVIFERSRAQAVTAGRGKMAAVGFTAAEAEAALVPFAGKLCLAAVNGPRSVTVSGDVQALDDLGRALRERGVFFRLLDLDYAFHSEAMDPIRDPLLRSLEGLSPSRARVRFVSTVRGADLEGTEVGPCYWWENVREPVRFQSAVDRLVGDGFRVFLEIGPHPVLGGYLNECAAAQGQTATVVATLRRNAPERSALLTAVAQCCAGGCAVDLEPYFPVPGRYVRLPTYPWQRERCWVEHDWRGADHPLLGERIETGSPTWSHRLDTPRLDYLSQHVVGGVAVLPGAGFLEMALAAAQRLHPDAGTYEVDDVELRRALLLPPAQPPLVELSVTPDDGGFTIRSRSSRNERAWVVNAVGKLGPASSPKPPPPASVETLRAGLRRHVSSEVIYQRLAPRHGLRYGPAFQGIAEMWGGEAEGLSRIEVPDEVRASLGDYCLHPAVLDACFQGVLPMATDDGSTWLPVRIRRLRWFGSRRPVEYCHLRLEQNGARARTGALTLLDADGDVVAEIDGLRIQQVGLTRSTTGEAPLWAWRPEYRSGPLPEVVLSGLPGPAEIRERLHGRVSEMIVESRRAELYARYNVRASALCAAYAARALEQLGARDRPFTPSSLVAERGVLPHYQRLLGRYLEMLEEDGILDRVDGRWSFRPGAGYVDADQAWREFVAESPDALAEMVLAGECGDRLAEVLKGDVDPLEVMSLGHLEHLYESAPVRLFYNRIVREVVREIARAWPRSRPLRVLEIGGGTGGMTAHIVPLLPRDRTHYVFTDISDLFLARTAPKFEAYPFMQYRRLDIEADPVGQGFPAGSFDLVVAGFVVHATADLRRTLGNVRRLLTTDGQLLMSEVHDRGRLVHLVFGLLKGWWAFTDTELRTKSPLLGPEQWVEVLQATGFDECAVFNDAEALAPQESVVLARSPQAEACAPAVVEAAPPRRWVVFEDTRGSGLETARRLAAAGHRVVTVAPGLAFARIDETRFVVPVGDRDGYARLFAELAGEGFACDDVVHLWGLATELGASGGEQDESMDLRSASVLLLLQGVRRSGIADMPRLWIVTCGGVGHPAYGAAAVPDQAAAWGLGRVLQNYTRCKLVDVLGVDNAEETGRLLLAELQHPGDEDEILLVNGTRFVNRLRRTSVPEQTEYFRAGGAEDGGDRPAFQVDFETPGVLDSLYLRAIPVPPPGPHQVVIRVRAAALNFHDVLWAMGMLPPEAVENGLAGPGLGMECAGEVAAVGEAVTDVAVGDGVIAFASYCLASHVVADSATVVRKPRHISFPEAVTIPTVFLTAVYALETLARMEPGERLLVHGAAGGVGLAAIQIARRKGIEVFGTAGTPEKRAFLRRMGVDHVLDSRSLAFADDVMEITGGEGVDVVLNSLSGEAIYRNLQVLKPFGRFVEIGRRDHFANTKMGLRPFRNNISYFGVDVDQLMLKRPELARRLFDDILDLVGKQELRPLVHRVFPVSRVKDAFRHMQQGGHIGKVVVSMEEERLRVSSKASRSLSLREDATYLIVGGLGGFGMATARWMVTKGARHLVLMGRRGASTEEAREGIAELRARGAQVVVAQADVADEDRLREVFDEIARELPPLRGVVHAALVLSDASPFELDQEQWQRVVRPKVRGAWNLDRLCRDKPLDFFILYSSAATLVGNPGQPNYVAANLYLEALAARRAGHGLPGLAVAWGAIKDVGYVARTEQLGELLAQRGLRPMESTRALAALEQLMLAGTVQAGVADIEWPKIFKTLGSKDQPKYEYMQHDAGESGGAESQESLRQLLADVPDEERPARLARLLAEHLARILRTSAAKLDVDRPIAEMGVDSLMTVELAASIEKHFGVPLPVMELLDRVTLLTIATRILKEAMGAPASPQAAPVGRLPGEPSPRPPQGAAPGALADEELSYGELSKCSMYRSGDGISAQDLWFQQALAVSLSPRLDASRLSAAFARVVDRHAALRTTYPGSGILRRRRIAPAHAHGVEVFEVEALSDEDLGELLRSSAAEPFDLGEGPLFRMQLYRRSDDRDVLVIRLHEIVADGWSVMVLAQDLLAAYVEPDSLPADGASYAEFARWQREWVRSERGASSLAYWRRQLRGVGPRLDLPFDHARRSGRVMRAGSHGFFVDARLSEGVGRLAAACGTTPYAVLLAAFDVVLHGCTGRTDLVVTGVFSGRTRAEFQRLVGTVSRRVWLRARIAGDMPFDEFLGSVAQTVREGLENQDYPASLVHAEVAPAGESALDQVGFSVGWPEHLDDRGLGIFLVNAAGAAVDYGGFHVESLPILRTGGLRDLHAEIQLFAGRIHCELRYSADLFEAATVERLASAYEAVIAAVVSDPRLTVARIVPSAFSAWWPEQGEPLGGPTHTGA